MLRYELLNKIKNAIQREKELKEEMSLMDIEEWDSLAVLAVIALYDELFSVNLKYSSLNKIITVKDLLDLAKDKMEQE
jgi:acyl carrier protein